MKDQIILLIGIFLSLTLTAKEDVAQFFEDGGISNPDNAFKIDILATAGGDFTLLHERFFIDELSLEVGGNLLLVKVLTLCLFLSKQINLEQFAQVGINFYLIPDITH